ncbi:unnamed protein product [Taenia asiatica]|uniref:Uncharacterized protein n=1 Tax=Taenia asiatica TaxID=60517 RepID=A0A0R3W8E9_TAEAS|nr:unnamed protein product [Taenia asiatica]
MLKLLEAFHLIQQTIKGALYNPFLSTALPSCRVCVNNLSQLLSLYQREKLRQTLLLCTVQCLLENEAVKFTITTAVRSGSGAVVVTRLDATIAFNGRYASGASCPRSCPPIRALCLLSSSRKSLSSALVAAEICLDPTGHLVLGDRPLLGVRSADRRVGDDLLIEGLEETTGALLTVNHRDTSLHLPTTWMDEGVWCRNPVDGGRKTYANALSGCLKAHRCNLAFGLSQVGRHYTSCSGDLVSGKTRSDVLLYANDACPALCPLQGGLDAAQ